jgi:light-regulated signal transduction histidine kinase (bacteriophytochrome)
MSTLIDSLLSYSQARETKAEVSEVDLGQTLQLVLVKMKKAITDSKATINFDKLPVVLADKIQMEHLLQNLISNAIKFQEGRPERVVGKYYDKGDQRGENQ